MARLSGKGISVPNPLIALRHAGSAALAALLPQSCFVCGELAPHGLLCPACSLELPAAPAPACPRCANASPLGEVCARCLKRPPHFDSTHACFAFDFPVREMVHALKFHARFAVARFAAEALLARAPIGGADRVVAVPLHPKRLRERGYNQALLLARPLARSLGLPLEVHTVIREHDAAHQVALALAARRRNLRGAFRALRRFDGLRILVVDDVMTSGATLDELAAALKAAGASEVHNLVLARTL